MVPASRQARPRSPLLPWFSNHPPVLQIFEVEIEKMVDRWSGSIELGVTTIGPEDIRFPNTMTDIDYDTWMLSGSAVMQDGATIKNG